MRVRSRQVKTTVTEMRWETVPQDRGKMTERPAWNFKTRSDRRTIKGDDRSRASWPMRSEWKKRPEISGVTTFERFVSNRDNFIMNSLIYCEPMKWFENRSDMMKFWSFGDGTSSRIQNKLKAISLNSWKIKQKRVTVVQFGMNERSSNSASSRVIKSITNTS